MLVKFRLFDTRYRVNFVTHKVKNRSVINPLSLTDYFAPDILFYFLLYQIDY